MTNSKITMILFCVMCFCIAPMSGGIIQGYPDPGHIKDEYIILLNKQPSENLPSNMMSTVRTKIEHDLGSASIMNTFTIGAYQVLHVKSDLVDRISDLADMEEVKSISLNTMECDAYVDTPATATMGSPHSISKSSSQLPYTTITSNPNTTKAATPNLKTPVLSESCRTEQIDRHLNLGHWGLGRITSRDRVCLQTGVTYSHLNTESGEGVTVYVFDTGINVNHFDFSGRASHFYKDTSIDEDESDQSGHGTHVAGIVGGDSNGIANKVNLKSVKVMTKFNCGTIDAIIGGLQAVVNDYKENKQKSVCCLSLSFIAVNEVFEDLIAEATEKGLPFIVSAGNTQVDACAKTPARMQSVITVGATTMQDQLASFSNYGNCVDILAPGVDIASASHDSNNSRTTKSGTSMACPFVAGIVAKHLQGLSSSTTPEDIKEWLIDTATGDKIDIAPNHPPGTSAEQTPNKLAYWPPCDVKGRHLEFSCNIAIGGGAKTSIASLWTLFAIIIVRRWTLI